MELSVLTCNYNTPEITKNLFKSIERSGNVFAKKYVVDTSEEYGRLELYPNVIEMAYPGKSHGYAVNYAMEHINDEYVLLVDSDVLFFKDISKVFEKFVENDLTLMGDVMGDRGGKRLHPRVAPWFCLMNFKKLKEHNIKFFDPERTKNSKESGDVIYDVGSTMFEDVIKHDLKVGDVKLEGKYFRHYEGMSWRTKKYDPNSPDTDIDFGGTHNNKALYEYGLLVENQYKLDVEKL